MAAQEFSFHKIKANTGLIRLRQDDETFFYTLYTTVHDLD